MTKLKQQVDEKVGVGETVVAVLKPVTGTVKELPAYLKAAGLTNAKQKLIYKALKEAGLQDPVHALLVRQAQLYSFLSNVWILTFPEAPPEAWQKFFTAYMKAAAP